MKLYDELNNIKVKERAGWVLRNASFMGRTESVAEHMCSMCYLIFEILNNVPMNVDAIKCYKMAVYHDLCETYAPDYTPYDNITKSEKLQKELEVVKYLSEKHNVDEILSIWQEFESLKTEESKFVKDVDRLDAILQSKIYSQVCSNPELFKEFSTYASAVWNKYENYSFINGDNTFYSYLFKLKTETLNVKTKGSNRKVSYAEYIYSLLILLFENYYKTQPNIDLEKTIYLVLFSCFNKVFNNLQIQLENFNLTNIYNYVSEYEENKTNEAHFVYYLESLISAYNN